jgi:hypothetical protein
MFGIGQPGNHEAECLANLRLWESLIPLVEMIMAEDEPFPKKKASEPDYDWRVVVAKKGK